ncbi:hypothetical protein Sjap_025449 [Stephania japonica]|uniref:Uncharacterized protein n=1 Tax=Stephania japonica TaxID=461633 RepID=A0AAP0E4W2_9MAGN
MATSPLLMMWNGRSPSSMEDNNNGDHQLMMADQTAVEVMEVMKDQQQQQKLQSDQNVKQRGRSKSSGKVAAPKRPPQRGLGVAQLERLRLQERWKKMTEIHANHHQFQFQFPFPISAHGGGGGPPPVPPPSSSSPFPSVHDQYLKFTPAARNYGTLMSDGGSGGGGGVYQPFAAVDRARNAAGELSSSQNIHGSSVMFDRNSTNYTRGLSFHHGENLGFVNGGNIRGHNHQNTAASVESCDLLRLNLGQTSSTTSTIADGSSRGINLWRASASANYSSWPDAKEEVEVVAVHRRGNPTTSGPGSVVMEYEFFPSRSTNYSNKQCHSYSSIAEANHRSAEQSSMSTEFQPSISNTDSSAATNNTNLIDLSLRLSC